MPQELLMSQDGHTEPSTSLAHVVLWIAIVLLFGGFSYLLLQNRSISTNTVTNSTLPPVNQPPVNQASSSNQSIGVQTGASQQSSSTPGNTPVVFSTGGVSWGQISGLLFDQADLGDALALKIPTSALDSDVKLSSNSNSRIATQKAVKAYVDANKSLVSGAVWGTITGTLADQIDLLSVLGSKVPLSYLDADATLAANSDARISTQKAVKAYVDTGLAAKQNIIGFTPEHALTFSTGLTRSGDTITANLSTGVVGGQSVVGGTAAGNGLTLSSTTSGTKGKILVGSSAYDEATNRLGIGTAAPLAALDVSSSASVSTVSSDIGTAIGTGTGNITVSSTAGFPSSGFAGLNDYYAQVEGVTYTVVDGTTLNITARGMYGTSAVSHPDGGTSVAYVQVMVEQGTSSPVPLAVSSNGSVGVDTLSPVEKFHVHDGNIAIDQDQYISLSGNWNPGYNFISRTSAGLTYIHSVGGGGEKFQLNSTYSPAAIFDFNYDDGRVGIGTATPGALLDVNGAANINGKLTVTGAIDPPSVRLSGGSALFFESADGSTAAVSASDEGRIRFNKPTETWQQSTNGSAYTDIGAGSGMAIGSPISGVTNGSVLFASSGNLAQNNTNLFWDNTNKELGIGTTTPAAPLHVALQDATTASFSNMLQLDHTSTGTTFGGFGSAIRFGLQNDGGTTIVAGNLLSTWRVATAGGEESTLGMQTFSAALGYQETLRALAAGVQVGNVGGPVSATLAVNQAVATSGTPKPALVESGAGHTGLSNAEAIDFDFNNARTVSFSGGGAAITNQRSVRFRPPTYASIAPQVITNAATLAIGGAPVAGLNMTITSPAALWVQTGNAIFGGSIGIGTSNPGQKLEVNGGLRLNTATAQPTCDSTTRGTFWVVQNGAGVKDDVQVCTKDAADAYAWRTIY